MVRSRRIVGGDSRPDIFSKLFWVVSSRLRHLLLLLRLDSHPLIHIYDFRNSHTLQNPPYSVDIGRRVRQSGAPCHMLPPVFQICRPVLGPNPSVPDSPVTTPDDRECTKGTGRRSPCRTKSIRVTRKGKRKIWGPEY